MSASINPDIVTDGLVLCYDAANSDCYRGEPTTNKINGLYSTSFANSGFTITNNYATNFDGSNTASLLFSGSWIARTGGYSSGFVSGNTYTTTWILKNVDMNTLSLNWGGVHTGTKVNVVVNLINGTVSSASDSNLYGIYSLGDGWYAIWYITTLSGTAHYPQLSASATGKYILYGGMQVEEKNYPTPIVNGTRGGTVATGGGLFDLSNNNNHGDINRTSVPTSSFYTPNNRGGFVFDGNNDYSRPTISHHYRDSSALEVIFNSSSHGGVFPNSYKTIMGYRHNGNYSLPTIGSIYLNNTTLSASVITTSQVYRTATFSSPIQTNQTYHVVLNKDTTNGILQLFVNGVAGDAQTFDASTYAQWSSVGNFIGANILDIGKSTNTNAGQGWGNDYFNGNIYKISVYNDILTPQQILDNYRAIKGRYGL